MSTLSTENSVGISKYFFLGVDFKHWEFTILSYGY